MVLASRGVEQSLHVFCQETDNRFRGLSNMERHVAAPEHGRYPACPPSA